MGRVTSEGARVQGAELIGTKHFPLTQTISATLTLTDNSPDLMAIAGGASNRDVMLPATGVSNNGRVFMIFNAGGTNSLVVKHSSGSPTVATILFGDGAIVANVNGTWYALNVP